MGIITMNEDGTFSEEPWEAAEDRWMAEEQAQWNPAGTHRQISDEWGSGWVFDGKRIALTCPDWDPNYEVDPERWKTSADLLDSIFQLAGKLQLTNEQLGAFVRAVNSLLRPQSTLCGSGYEHGPINVKKTLAARGKLAPPTEHIY